MRNSGFNTILLVAKGKIATDALKNNNNDNVFLIFVNALFGTIPLKI